MIRYADRLTRALLPFAALSFLLIASTAHAGAMRSGFTSSTFSGNDDGSQGPIAIGFPVDFFGVVASTLWVNNNGNITLDGPLGTYTPFDLTSTGQQIIAPFFGDVMTSTNSNPVRYGAGTVDGHTAFGATWDLVNCYHSSTSRSSSIRNSFQVVLIERSDTGPNNFDFELNIDQVKWEAGMASGGSSDCLGGNAARVGYSNGSNDPGTFFELVGSDTVGAFLDTGPSALINSSVNSTQLGRYLFSARNGTIAQPGDIPVGVSGGPYSGVEGVPITVSGGGSGDFDGTVVQYSWDCEDDGVYDFVSTSATGTCTYPDNGVYVARLIVTDNEGNQNSVATTVVVDNADPTNVSIGGATTGSEGVSLTVNGFGTDVPADPLSYGWDFGDGTTGSGSSVNHTYTNNGAFIVTLTVSDGDGGVVTTTGTITVSNTAPNISTTTVPTSGQEGVALTVSATGGDAGSDTLIYRWDFGDGTQIATGASVSHVYADQGTFTIGVTLSDSDGATDTSSSSISIANVNPVISFTNIPSSGDESQTLLFEAAASDVLADPLTYTWTFGDGGTVTGASVSHVYIDEGTPTVTLVVTDGDGGSATVSSALPIANIDPQISNVVVPAAGDEGQIVTMSADAVDAAGDAMTFVWDYGDGASDTYSLPLGNNASSTTHSYDDEGTYQITITVTDGDGGIDVFNQSVITISNLDPVVASFTVPSGAEGDVLSFAVVASDAPGDPLTYQWDFGDGTSDTGPTATHTFTDDGGYAVSMTIQDDGEGGETIVTAVSTITNVAPTITSVVAPGTGDEGEALQFDVVSDDVGVDDIPDHVATWDWGDGSSDTGASLTHAYIDQGTWTVTLTVDDQDSGTASQTMTVVTSNVAPLITSTPPTNAIQGTLYTYEVLVTEPGDDVLEFSLAASAPAGMTIDPATGIIEFTATYAQSLSGPYTVVISVTDNEGGVDGQVYTLNVLSADTDGDGIADDWETANGLDPNDSGDGFLDSDLDGLTNVEEFGLDQDPFTYDGPTNPTAIFPIGGEEVDTDRPDLTVSNATDPNGDFLTYEYEVYAEIALTTLVTSMTGVAEDASGSTFWKVDVPLDENANFWWRARANDGAVSGGWTATESFFVNTENEAPGPVTLVWPLDGESTGSLTPTLEWTIAEDGDQDEVLYDVEIWDEAGENLVVSMTGVTTADGDINATWTVDVALDEDTFYSWSVLPVDEHGLEGEWTDPALFFSDGTDEAPQEVAFIEPINNSSIVTPTPRLVATEGWDPEGTEVTYGMEVDTVGTFDSSDYESTTLEESGTGEIVWDLGVAGVTLPENSWIFARVQATDEGGVSSPPDTITFFVRGDNDAPPVPTLLSPEDGAESDDTTPTLTVETPVDPEADVVYIEFALARDIDLDDVIGGVDSVLATGDSTGWVLDPPVNGTFYWSARAFDENGATSGWADPWLYTAPDEQVVGDDDDDDSTGGGGTGCDCTNSITGSSSAPGLLLFLMLVPVLAVRRRR